MKLKERLVFAVLLFVVIFVLVAIKFVVLAGPGRKKMSENAPTLSLNPRKVPTDVLGKVRANMILDMMKFLQADDPRLVQGVNTASSSSVSYTSPTTHESNHSKTVGNATTPQKDPWMIWASWVKPKVFYSPDVFWSEEMNSILHALATSPVTSLELGHRGTQLKATMYLQGDQRTVFKPKRCVLHGERGGGDKNISFCLSPPPSPPSFPPPSLCLSLPPSHPPPPSLPPPSLPLSLHLSLHPSLSRYKRDSVVGDKNDPYAGYDRHNGEIAGFHLDG